MAFPAASLDWIPLACVIVFVAAFSLGLNPISWLLVGEVFPLEYRSLGTSLATAFSYVCAFVGVKTFVDLRVNLHMYYGPCPIQKFQIIPFNPFHGLLF